MCDDWYRSPLDGACFGVLETLRLRPMTTPRYISKRQSKSGRRVTHYDYGGIAFCQVEWKPQRQARAPLLTHKEETITCPRCLDKFGRQDATNRGHGE